MTTITVSRKVHAAPARVWQVFTDIAGAPASMPSITAVEVLSQGPFGPGFRWRETRRMFGQNATEEMWVTAAQEPTGYEVCAESRGTRYTSRYTFTEDADGTQVELAFTATPLGTVAKLMSVLAPKAVLAKAFAKDLADLATACEAG